MEKKSVVPNPWVVDQHRFVGHLVPDRTNKKLALLHFIYYLKLNDVLFLKITRLSL